jgi:hypothetical protein
MQPLHTADALCFAGDGCASLVVVLVSTGACSVAAFAGCQLQAHADHFAALFSNLPAATLQYNISKHIICLSHPVMGAITHVKLDDKFDQQYVAFADNVQHFPSC